MASNKVTNNIYDSWLSTLATLSHEYTKGLDSLSKEEIHHLIWLLVEELNSREAKIKDEK